MKPVNATHRNSLEEEEALSDNHQPNVEVIKFKIIEPSADEIRYETFSIKKTLALLWLCCILSNAPTVALVSSASSLLNDEGLGVASLAASGSAQFLLAAVLLSYLTKTWGIRNVLRVTFWLPAFYSLSFLYPNWGTMLVAGFLLGFGKGAISAMFMYGYSLAFYYARITNTRMDAVLAFVAGFLASAFGAAVVCGNLLLYLILRLGSEEKNLGNLTVASNDTNFSEKSHDICGANYCNEGIIQLENVELPDVSTYYTMIGVFFSLAVLGGILSIFIRDFSRQFGSRRRKKSEFLLIVKETWFLLKDPRGYLLVAMTVFAGLEEGFIHSEYTQAYVSCVLGIPAVGLIVFAYGGTQIVAGIVQGFLVKYVGRTFVIVLGFCILMSLFVTLLLWQPSSDQVAIFFLISVLFSAANGILLPAAFGMYGILFEDNVEGSLSLAAFWWSLGYTIYFLWSPYLCVYVKIYLTMILGCVGLAAYLLLEYLRKKDSFKTGKTSVHSKN